jgi:hypothetical protein
MVPMAKARVAHSEIRHAALRKIGLAGFENISDTSQCLNEWLTPLRVDLAAETVDMNIDYVRIGLDANAPDLSQQHRPRHDSTCVAA